MLFLWTEFSEKLKRKRHRKFIFDRRAGRKSRKTLKFFELQKIKQQTVRNVSSCVLSTKRVLSCVTLARRTRPSNAPRDIEKWTTQNGKMFLWTLSLSFAVAIKFAYVFLWIESVQWAKRDWHRHAVTMRQNQVISVSTEIFFCEIFLRSFTLALYVFNDIILL